MSTEPVYKNVTWREWVDALRSGGWKQGVSALRTPSDGFCCLGVQADLVCAEAWTGADVVGLGWISPEAEEVDGQLPDPVMSAMNDAIDTMFASSPIRDGWFKHRDDIVHRQSFTNRLMNMNDGPDETGGDNFRGIAAFIESMCNIHGVDLDSVIYDWSEA